jgi:hypothetical protein
MVTGILDGIFEDSDQEVKPRGYEPRDAARRLTNYLESDADSDA